MKHCVAAIVVSVGLTIAFILLIDPAYLEWRQAEGFERNKFFSIITDIGKSNWILVSTASLLIFMSITPAIVRGNNRFKVYWHYIFLRIYFVFMTTAICGGVVSGLKQLIGRARPSVDGLESVWVFSPLSGSYFASFPSGHSAIAGTMIVSLILVMPKSARWIIPLGMLVAVSRFMVGVHFPSDVVAGLFLGAIIAYLHARYFAQRRLIFDVTDNGWLALRKKAARHALRNL